MVGILEREDLGCDLAFGEAGLDVILFGETRDELGGSEWAQMFMSGTGEGACPPLVDLDREKSLVELLVSLHENRLLRSAHDVSNGGVAVALAEMSMGGVGCHVKLAGGELDAVALLFSESQARALVATHQASEVLNRAKAHGVPAALIGRTENAVFIIEPFIRTTAPELMRVWRSAFALLLGGDDVDRVIRGVGEEAPEVIAR
jgi:phosphoribosylformylglycinamidine synthase